VGSSGPATSRSGQDLHLASIGSRSPALADSIIAASPSRRRHSLPALVSMAARAGAGNRHPGAGSESGPAAATTLATTKLS
jgi:hypothetical protein